MNNVANHVLALLLLLSFAGCGNDLEGNFRSANEVVAPLSLAKSTEEVRRGLAAVANAVSAERSPDEKRRMLDTLARFAKRKSNLSFDTEGCENAMSRRMHIAGGVSQILWREGRPQEEVADVILGALNEYRALLADGRRLLNEVAQSASRRRILFDRLRRLEDDRRMYARLYLELSPLFKGNHIQE